MATSSKHRGWRIIGPAGNPTALGSFFNNTEVFRQTASALTVAKATAVTGGIAATTGDVDVTAGNFRAGVKSAFVTTEPTSALVMKTGTAPAGAITTSGGIFASATVVRKIIADGTVSNVET